MVKRLKQGRAEARHHLPAQSVRVTFRQGLETLLGPKESKVTFRQGLETLLGPKEQSYIPAGSGDPARVLRKNRALEISENQLQLIVLASGSKANALLLRDGSTRLLVDAGLGIRSLYAALQLAGEYPQHISAAFLTHEHSDHTRGLAALLKKTPIPVYATAGTLTALSPGFMRKQKAFPMNGIAVDVGPFTVRALAVSHDAAEPVAYQIHCGNDTVTVATDLGEVSPELHAAFAVSTVAVIESNHDEELLRTGSYPPILKQRIASNTGHLSNRQTADVLRDCRNKSLKHVVLAHLSEENNHPDLARDSARTALDTPEIAVHLTAQRTFGPLLTL